MKSSAKHKHIAAAVALLAGALAGTADARLVRLDITAREVVAGGMAFGDTGAYEKLTGTAHFEVDPRDEANRQVFDLEKAPRNRRGRVEFSADAVILKPIDMKKGNRGLFFEVNNRGNKIALPMFNDTPPGSNNNNPSAPADFGNGFLMRQGYVVAWVGWGADIAPGNSRLTVNFPVAAQHGQPITERIVTEYSDRNFGGATPFSLPLSGGPNFKSYESVSTDAVVAEAELRRRPSDSPRPPSAAIPPGELVPASEWSFADCPSGAPGTPSPNHICLAGGFQNNMVYELRYRATRSPVMGLGYLTSRDFVSFLKESKRDDGGSPNPVQGVDVAYCLGISSSGMYYRDYLYQGFNTDERGRRVCDGMHIHIPGVHKLYLNYRFAQPNPFSVQHRERYVPDANFPRRYQQENNPLGGWRGGILDAEDEDSVASHDRRHDAGFGSAHGTPWGHAPASKAARRDGILDRDDKRTKIIHTDSGTEYWQFRSSLVDTDDHGSTDLRHPRNVRRYLYASTQHFPTKGATPNFGTGDRQCEQLNNVTHPGPMSRALLAAASESRGFHDEFTPLRSDQPGVPEPSAWRRYRRSERTGRTHTE
ncbi:MAG: alpha/beta hydrolase domain-containing protein [Burkholderiaceae bacterium]